MYKYKTSGKKHAVKDTAWKWFSLYIRLRDCIATTGTDMACVCVTCGNQITEPQAGHGIPGRHNAVLFDESIVYGQCKTCNETGSGERQAFRAFLVLKHGESWMIMKEQGSKQSVFYSDLDFRAIAKEYREKYNALKDSIS